MTGEMRQASEEVYRVLSEVSDALREIGGMQTRPLLGGVFGVGRFHLGTTVFRRNGLHAMYCFVIDSETGFLLSVVPGDKAAAIGLARRILSTVGPITAVEMMERYKAKREAEERAKRVAIAAEVEAIEAPRSNVRSIPRRRQRIFDECGGKCFYCKCELELEGKWHVEHKMPRALGGDNAPGNLVASCVPCNLAKRDRTDQEFIASGGRR